MSLFGDVFDVAGDDLFGDVFVLTTSGYVSSIEYTIPARAYDYTLDGRDHDYTLPTRKPDYTLERR